MTARLRRGGGGLPPRAGDPRDALRQDARRPDFHRGWPGLRALRPKEVRRSGPGLSAADRPVGDLRGQGPCDGGGGAGQACGILPAQKKYPEVHEALERSTAIRATFPGDWASRSRPPRIHRKTNGTGKAFYRRGLSVLDPPNPINEICGNSSKDAQSYGRPTTQIGDARQKTATPPKKTNKL